MHLEQWAGTNRIPHILHRVYVPTWEDWAEKADVPLTEPAPFRCVARAPAGRSCNVGAARPAGPSLEQVGGQRTSPLAELQEGWSGWPAAGTTAWRHIPPPDLQEGVAGQLPVPPPGDSCSLLTCRKEWLDSCQYHHPAWRHMFWDEASGLQLVQNKYAWCDT